MAEWWRVTLHFDPAMTTAQHMEVRAALKRADYDFPVDALSLDGIECALWREPLVDAVTIVSTLAAAGTKGTGQLWQVAYDMHTGEDIAEISNATHFTWTGDNMKEIVDIRLRDAAEEYRIALQEWRLAATRHTMLCAQTHNTSILVGAALVGCVSTDALYSARVAAAEAAEEEAAMERVGDTVDVLYNKVLQARARWNEALADRLRIIVSAQGGEK